MTSYEGDPQKYHRFKDGKYKVRCLSEYWDKEGRRHICNFKMREDRFKEKLKMNKLHECKYVIVDNESTLDGFFEKQSSNNQKTITVDDLYTRLATFIGKRNLSIECGASEDCIALGISS